jgi:hypothetical protein
VVGTGGTDEANLGLQTFRRRKGNGEKYEFVGTAPLGVQVMCVLPAKE